MTEALLGFLAIFVLALIRMPLAFSMGLVGIVGIGLTRGWMPALASTAQVVHETGFAYTLSVIPLFILMGNFVARAGLAHELFHAAYTFIGHRKGGLAQQQQQQQGQPAQGRPTLFRAPVGRCNVEKALPELTIDGFHVGPVGPAERDGFRSCPQKCAAAENLCLPAHPLCCYRHGRHQIHLMHRLG